MIILIYGQPASGKTTLANEIYKGGILSNRMLFSNTVLLDGDRWRSVSENEDYSKEGRMNNLKQSFDAAVYLEREGFLPILSFVTPYESMRKYLRRKSKLLIEVYLECYYTRGRNEFFVKDFEYPKAEDDVLRLDTGAHSIVGCYFEVMNYLDYKTNKQKT